jgi:U32 family peptidase
MSLLNRLRRELVARLDEAAESAPSRSIAREPVLPSLLAPMAGAKGRELAPGGDPGRVELSVLCRRTEQIEAAVAQGIATIYADYQDIKGYTEAIATARRGGSAILLATPRIQKPGEANLFKYLGARGADGLLVRNAGGLRYCSQHAIAFVADFSMNAANPLSVESLRSRGALRVTASYDLDVNQLLDLLDAVPPSWLEVVIHQRIPMFHMEHCVFCAFLSPGTDATNCGRPCDHHDVKLRDRVGAEHHLKADIGCRNTLFNAVPQTAAEYLPRIISHGATHLRVEFLDEDAASVERTLSLYREALSGRRDVKRLWKELKANNQYGVTRGPLAVI